MKQPDLIIIGGGAAGLMAGAAAGEAGLRAIVLERCPKPGRKLLMCGNNRCNLTSALPAEQLLANYGAPLDTFLEPAIRNFSPGALRDWFRANGLQTKVQRDQRVYPQSERAIDVHRCLTDQLARHSIALMLNSPATQIQPTARGFAVQTANLELETRRILIATGGVSYPKTGSVGDGQKIAAALGHKILPYRPGLAGIQLPHHALRAADKVELTIFSKGEAVATTHGALEIEKYGISGPAVINACRILSRQKINDPTFEIRRGGQTWRIQPGKPRPLKEAMTTVGGVSLAQIDPRTMQSTLVPGLYFAGEVIDVDGPCGGYNLQAAFSMARLAVQSMCPEFKRSKPAERNPPKKPRARQQTDHFSPKNQRGKKRPNRRPKGR